MAYQTAKQIYAQQNKVLNMAFSRLGMPYSANKETWLSLMGEIAGRNVSGLSDLTLLERRMLIAHFNGRSEFAGKKNLFNPILSKRHYGWRKGDPDTLPENVARPLSVNRARFPAVAKIGAILAELKLPWSYADAIAKSRFKVEIVEWCEVEDIRSILKMMIIHQKRQ